jgi:hypothetical protein
MKILEYRKRVQREERGMTRRDRSLWWCTWYINNELYNLKLKNGSLKNQKGDKQFKFLYMILYRIDLDVLCLVVSLCLIGPRWLSFVLQWIQSAFKVSVVLYSVSQRHRFLGPLHDILYLWTLHAIEAYWRRQEDVFRNTIYPWLLEIYEGLDLVGEDFSLAGRRFPLWLFIWVEWAGIREAILKLVGSLFFFLQQFQFFH